MDRRKVRIKKLAPKTQLSVLLEHQIDKSEYESLSAEIQAAAGVDESEKNEVHLQAALKGAGATTTNEIPVPPPQESVEVNYNELYTRRYIEPKGYIKFSDTVEETLDCLYDMTTEDDEYLKTYNNKKPTKEKLSETDFERLMEFLEQTAAEYAPYAAVDNTAVSYEVMQEQVVRSPVNKLHTHIKAVYGYWSTQRQACGSRSLQPSLKFEMHQESDDLDAYVCFRRREVRQTRKTRQRDGLVADKLKKLRRELEDGRQLVLLAYQREVTKKQMLMNDKALFEARAKLKARKTRLSIRADDEDLYNTRPQKRKVSEVQPASARNAAQITGHRLAVRPEGRPSQHTADHEPVQLADQKRDKYDELNRNLEAQAKTHEIWNQNFIDLTKGPLSPPRSVEDHGYRAAQAQFLPTPPVSHEGSMDLDDEPAEPVESGSTFTDPKAPSYFSFRGMSSYEKENTMGYRRRVGRGGRTWVDRQFVARAKLLSRASLVSPTEGEFTTLADDRFKYDNDDSDDEQPVYSVDPFDERFMKYRASNTFTRPPGQAPRAPPGHSGPGTHQNHHQQPQPQPVASTNARGSQWNAPGGGSHQPHAQE